MICCFQYETCHRTFSDALQIQLEDALITRLVDNYYAFIYHKSYRNKPLGSLSISCAKFTLKWIETGRWYTSSYSFHNNTLFLARPYGGACLLTSINYMTAKLTDPHPVAPTELLSCNHRGWMMSVFPTYTLY